MLPNPIEKEITAKIQSEMAKRFMDEISAIECMPTGLIGNLSEGYTYVSPNGKKK